MTQHDYGRAGNAESEADRLGRAAQTQADKASREAGTVAEEARGAARDVMDEARRTGQAVKKEAAGLVGTVQQQLSSRAEAQKDSLADRLAAVAEQVHGTAENLRGREAWLADLVDRGARELDGLADELRHRDVRSLIGGVETLAHRHPALFMGVAVACGFALSRMVRGAAPSTSSRGYAGDYRGQSSGAVKVGDYIDEPGTHPDLASSPSYGQGVGAAGTHGGVPGASSASPSVVRGSNI